ncbi:MAG: AIR carboxylase family protein, partial [Ignisphaera sp.]
IRVAEEAKTIVMERGCRVVTLYDVGIAGLHRVLEAVKRLKEEDVDVAIVVAGMEGALPSIVASLLDVPVIGVPTSVGYGIGGGGVSALYSMLQACPLGLAVVNIDNGINAGIVASLIGRRVSLYRSKRQL